ncbi:uncharacterized protein LOC141913930 [Tubulanus polymorphus]|uniref:uncharacterized protein LOC141913930 n=1 Tax=Tubulanus polymorphus TaxID=672921 RepID=UPI003DA57BF9
MYYFLTLGAMLLLMTPCAADNSDLVDFNDKTIGTWLTVLDYPYCKWMFSSGAVPNSNVGPNGPLDGEGSYAYVLMDNSTTCIAAALYRKELNFTSNMTLSFNYYVVFDENVYLGVEAFSATTHLAAWNWQQTSISSQWDSLHINIAADNDIAITIVALRTNLNATALIAIDNIKLEPQM